MAGKQSYFIWNGVDCRSKGIKLSGPVSIVRPEERVTHVQIPGRSGDLTQLEGTNIFNSYIQTASILVPRWYNVREIYSWLRGSGYVTFSGEPDRKQLAHKRRLWAEVERILFLSWIVGIKRSHL